MHSMYIRIRGMSCGGCVRQVQNALGRVPGVQVEMIGVGHASVFYDPARADPTAILAAIEDAGFTPEM